MKKIDIDLAGVSNESQFHEVFAKTLGFPDFYGKNMNAWIDCMTDIDDPDGRMTTVHIEPGHVLTLNLKNVRYLKKNCLKVYEALLECSAFVNYRRLEQGKSAVLALSFHE